MITVATNCSAFAKIDGDGWRPIDVCGVNWEQDAVEFSLKDSADADRFASAQAVSFRTKTPGKTYEMRCKVASVLPADDEVPANIRLEAVS